MRLAFLGMLSYLSLQHAVFAAKSPVPAGGGAVDFAPLVELCEKSSKPSKEIRAKLAKEFLPSSAYRVSVIKEISAGKYAKCASALAEYYQALKQSPKDVGDENGKRSFITIGVAANMPEALDALEAEMARDANTEWLDVLRFEAPALYSKGVRKFVAIMAKAIRENQNVPQTTQESYGASMTDTQARAPVIPTAPLVVERYLKDIQSSKRKLDASEFADLNAIFAGSTASFRQVFLVPLKDVLSKQSSDWIASFRKEPVWSQIRLFPLMNAIGGPEVARELMWLSSNHNDFRVRALADKSLDDLGEGSVGARK